MMDQRFPDYKSIENTLEMLEKPYSDNKKKKSEGPLFLQAADKAFVDLSIYLLEDSKNIAIKLRS